jgi:hypothetical protein
MVVKTSDSYDKMKNIAKLIQIFDDFTILKKTDPVKVEKIVNYLNDPTISKIWVRYAKVIHYLAYYPIKIPSIKHLINIKAILRIFLLSTLIYYILSFGYILHPKLFPAIIGDIKVFLTMLSISFASGFGLIFLEHRIRHKIIEWESKNKEILQPRIDKLVKGVNELIRVLVNYVKMHNDGSCIDNFVIELWREDYKGLKITGIKKIKKPFSSELINVYVYKIHD